MKKQLSILMLAALAMGTVVIAEDTKLDLEVKKDGIISRAKELTHVSATYLKDCATDVKNDGVIAAKTIWAKPMPFFKAFVTKKTWTDTADSLSQSDWAKAWLVGAATVIAHGNRPTGTEWLPQGNGKNLKPRYIWYNPHTRLPAPWYNKLGGTLILWHLASAAYDNAYHVAQTEAQEDSHPARCTKGDCKKPGCKGGNCTR